jgi:hypothetical protein
MPSIPRFVRARKGWNPFPRRRPDRNEISVLEYAPSPTQSRQRSAGDEKVTLADSSRFQFTPDLTICRLLNGMWQVSGAHGYIDPASAIAEMFAYHDAGLTTWDLADHYGPAEDFI